MRAISVNVLLLPTLVLLKRHDLYILKLVLPGLSLLPLGCSALIARGHPLITESAAHRSNFVTAVQRCAQAFSEDAAATPLVVDGPGLCMLLLFDKFHHFILYFWINKFILLRVIRNIIIFSLN